MTGQPTEPDALPIWAVTWNDGVVSTHAGEHTDDAVYKATMARRPSSSQLDEGATWGEGLEIVAVDRVD